MLAPGRRTGVWLSVAVLAITLPLIARSDPRHVGDAGEYTAMAVNLARFNRPSLTRPQLAEAAARLPEGAGANLTQPQMLAPDGRQDFAHFWFYPLLAAPLVHMAMVFGFDPQFGFTALNLALLIGLTLLLSTRLAPGAVMLVVLGPIIWWLDKPHTEVFTFSCVATALLLLREKPWWSIVAFGGRPRRIRRWPARCSSRWRTPQFNPASATVACGSVEPWACCWRVSIPRTTTRGWASGQV